MEPIQARLARDFDRAELRRIKRLWVRHSIAEDRRDIDGLVANDYTEDAEVLAGEFHVKGRDQLKQLFTGYLDMIGDFTLRSTDKFHESEDAIILEATMDTEKTGERKVYDCFVMRDGKMANAQLTNYIIPTSADAPASNGGGHGLVGDLLKSASNGLVRVIGDGNNHWPLVYDRDLADLYARLAASGDASGIYHANDEGDERDHHEADECCAVSKQPVQGIAPQRPLLAGDDVELRGALVLRADSRRHQATLIRGSRTP